MRLVFSMLAVVGLNACSGEDRHVVEDRGTVCVGSESPFGSCESANITADEPLPLFVNFGICLSSSCDRAGPTSCSAALDGSVIRVSAHGVFFTTTPVLNQDCTADCGFLSAQCEAPALAAGAYELEYGAQQLALTVPSTTRRSCVSTTPGVACCDTDTDCASGVCSQQSMCQQR